MRNSLLRKSSFRIIFSSQDLCSSSCAITDKTFILTSRAYNSIGRQNRSAAVTTTENNCVGALWTFRGPTEDDVFQDGLDSLLYICSFSLVQEWTFAFPAVLGPHAPIVSEIENL
jgi:hypothetical protein